MKPRRAFAGILPIVFAMTTASPAAAALDAASLDRASLAAAPERRLADAAQYRVDDPQQFQLSDQNQYRAAWNREPEAPPAPTPAPVIVADAVATPKQTGAQLLADIPSLSLLAARRDTPFQKLIDRIARAEGLEPELLHAVVAVESRYDPDARSPQGAIGLMQLMPATASQYSAQLSIKDLSRPADNLRAGAKHLRYLLEVFHDNVALALAAYNAGEQAVRKYAGRIPPYPETRAYVRRVLAYYRYRLLLRKESP